jgi:hypothetical protein
VELPVSVAEVIGGVSEAIERLTGQAGLLIMKAVMDAEVESLAGAKGRHNPDRTCTRWTAQPGYVVLAGKKVQVTKPRVRDKAGHEGASEQLSTVPVAASASGQHWQEVDPRTEHSQV